MQKLSDIGEDGLIKALTQHLPLNDNVVVGPGDDCAVLKNQGGNYTLLKTDTIIEGVHYLECADPYQVGWKAVARVVSDFAAMAGKPDALVIALAMKPDTSVEYLTQLYQGIKACAEQFKFSIVGGETSSTSCNTITVSGTGSCQNFVTRSNAKVGDTIYVTGQLGGSITGKHLTFTPRVAEAEWLNQHLDLHAMMDLSDGLAKDLPRLAKMSQVGFRIEPAALPCNDGCSPAQALGDGEDYELLFCSPTPLNPVLEREWQRQFPQLELTAIGQITASTESSLEGGWEHYH